MVLRMEHVRKEYRSGSLANDDVSLRVRAGEVYGLFGHNGAGKTTLVNQVVGSVRPTSGRITVDGRDVVADPGFARRTCAIQPQSQVPLRGVTPAQAVEMVARIRGSGRREARAVTEELFVALDITQWASVPGERLSGGVRRLTAFCMAAAGPSRVVMLDEPTNDVDPVRRRKLWTQIRSLAVQGRAVLVVTHNVSEAERCVDQLSILHLGRVVAAGTPVELCAARSGGSRCLEDVYIQLVGDKENDDAALVA